MGFRLERSDSQRDNHVSVGRARETKKRDLDRERAVAEAKCGLRI